jgi:hypothetical protein
VPATGSVLVLADHEARAVEHHRVADTLFAIGEEWAAVAYFYASLHRAQAALLTDPVFDNRGALQAKHNLLTERDRHCNKHQGFFRKPGVKVWGLNELVALFYPKVGVSYVALYRASIDVRYGLGLRRPSLGSLQADAERIHGEYAAGALKAS